MADWLTSISLVSAGFGSPSLAEWGKLSVGEATEAYRRYIEHLRWQVNVADATPDEALRICFYQGVHVQKNRQVIQEGTVLDYAMIAEREKRDA